VGQRWQPVADAEPWNGAQDNPSAASAFSAISCAIGAGSVFVGRQRATRNAPLAVLTGGCASFWPLTGAPRRCQSSLGYEPTTRVSPVSTVPERLADQAKALKGVAAQWPCFKA
jgi:hypothetical protein